MIGRINNVNSFNSINSLKANNISFGKRKSYTTTTTTTVAEGKTEKKTGFFKKIGLAILGTLGAIFAIGKLSEMKDKKGVDENKAADNKPAVDKQEDKKPEGEVSAVDGTDNEVVAKDVAEEAEIDEAPNEEALPELIADEAEADELEAETAEVADEIEEMPNDEAVPAEIEETEMEEAPVVAEEIDEVPAEDVVIDETPAEIIEETETPVAEAEAQTVEVAPEVDSKKQAQALLTAGMAGAMATSAKAKSDNKQVSAADYADSQKAQLGVATPKKAKLSKAKLENGEKILEDAFNVSLNGEQTASELKATLKEFRQYVKEANKNDFEDIITEDGGVVAFEKRVEYPEGETTGIVDEAITKYTREQEKQEILTATKLDAQGNLVGTATYINGRIDGLTKIEADGTMTTIQADDKGVLVAKGMQPTEKGVAFDEILNYDYVGDDRKLVSCAKGVKIENGVTDIKKAYKFDNDNNLKEFAKDVAITPDNKGVLGNNYQFESDNLVAAAALYNGDVSALGKGKAAEVYTFENDKLASTAKKAEYTVNV